MFFLCSQGSRVADAIGDAGAPRFSAIRAARQKEDIMKKLFGAACSLVLLAQASAALAVDHVSKTPMEVQSDADRPCAIFRLEGVTVADPNVSGSEWFAIPKTHPSYNELFAMLLTTKAGKIPISVRTSGGTACGFAAVNILAVY